MARINAPIPVKKLAAGNDTYERGFHKGNPGGLDAVDTDLATGNIKNGITMFGFAGSADVHDISDATAIAAEVIDGETFYAVSGGIRTGTMPIVALAPGSSAYPAGYHAGDGGGLPAIDGDLVTANIKSGITIFNVAGHNDVRNISDADLVVAEAPTGKTFYAVSGGRKTGTGTKTLNPANETVAAGYYAATTLSAVDAQLAAANIKSGITIFGFTGPATVQDIAAADAVLADVKNGKTFFSVTGGIKTGNLATVALAPGSSAYPAGYHAGEAGGLVDVDADLVTGSIKFGVTIFGVAGHTNVRDSSDADAAVANVLSPKTFYAGGGAKKTGTMATVALAAGANAYPAGYHAGAASLTAVDGDLAAGNIKDGITIFGVLGTFSQTLAEDIVGSAPTTITAPTGAEAHKIKGITVPAGGTTIIATKTQTYDSNSMAVGVAYSYCKRSDILTATLRLYMDGVVEGSSPVIDTLDYKNYVAMGTRALSGSKTCTTRIYNPGGSEIQAIFVVGGTSASELIAAMVAVGSIKSIG